jgi:hypothetical protein
MFVPASTDHPEGPGVMAACMTAIRCGLRHDQNHLFAAHRQYSAGFCVQYPLVYLAATGPRISNLRSNVLSWSDSGIFRLLSIGWEKLVCWKVQEGAGVCMLTGFRPTTNVLRENGE